MAAPEERANSLLHGHGGKRVAHKQSMLEMQDYKKHDEYDNRLNVGGREAPKGLPPRGLGAPNVRSMKNLELSSRGSGQHSNPH